jgi:ketosteroid isomerase-like protein
VLSTVEAIALLSLKGDTVAVSEENVKVVREVYQWFNQGQITLALDAFDPDVEWHITPQAGPAPGSYRGREGVRDAFDSMFDVWSAYQSEPLEFIDGGNFVLVRICVRGTGRASGIEVEDEVAHLWEVRDKKIHSFEAHVDSSRALEKIRAVARR